MNRQNKMADLWKLWIEESLSHESEKVCPLKVIMSGLSNEE
jgi:hypothetical protein